VLKGGLLFVPFALAELLAPAPVASYVVAWGGSWIILYATITGKVRPLPDDRPLARQILRPLIFTQVIFVSYAALTSIFHMAGALGYYYLQFSPAHAVSPRELALLAEAQRLYVLAHAALVTGVMLAMDYRASGRWQLNVTLSLPRLMLVAAAGALVGSYVLAYVPGLSQAAARLETLSLVASVLCLALALPTGETGLVALGGVLYGFNVFRALLSGWKEEVIVMVLLLGLFTYPHYRRTVTALTPVVLVLLLAFLPTYNSAFRSMNWSGDVQSRRAAAAAYERVESAGAEALRRNTWSFLTGRASEVGMFTTYLRKTPDEHGFYGLRLAMQSAESLVPRVLWPQKPITEQRVMQRVYDYDVAEPQSRVSAKPHFIVDSYLSAGAFGVFLFGLLYGVLASLASRLAERWFGGYWFGTCLVYTAFFQEMWTGNSFEFFFNTVFWSFVLMFALFMLGRYFGFLVPASSRG
jgi:hypothetical protein